MEEKLMYNYLVDITKRKELTHFERAELISNYLKLRNISVLTLSKELDIPKSTLHDWLLWNDISVSKKKELNDYGWNDTEIYKHLRKKGNFNIEKFKIDFILKRSRDDLKGYIHKTCFSDDTYDHIKDLINICNRLLLQMDKIQR